MSARATFWAWRAGNAYDLNSTERLVLLKLADGASEETGQCWYKQATIATWTGLSRSGVQKALTVLGDKGLLFVTARSHEGRTISNDYRLNLDVSVEAPLPTTEAPVPLFEDQAPTVWAALPTTEAGGAHQESTSYPSSVDPASKKKRSARPARPSVVIPDPPPEIDSPGLRAFLPEFAEYRRAVKKNPLDTLDSWEYLFNRLKPAGREHAVLALRLAMVRKWLSFKEEWLNGSSWQQVASELGLSLRKEEERAADPAVLAAAKREAAREARRAAFQQKLLALTPASDGWTDPARSTFLPPDDLLDNDHGLADRLAHVVALTHRLTALGAFPLQRPPAAYRAGGGSFEPGLIFPACGGGPWRPVLTAEGWSVDMPTADLLAAAKHATRNLLATDPEALPRIGQQITRSSTVIATSGKPNCPLETGLRPCMCEGLPRCPICNYSAHDAAFEMDHASCSGRIPDEEGEDFNCSDGSDMIGDDTPLDELDAEWDDESPSPGPALPNPPGLPGATPPVIDDPVSPNPPSPGEIEAAHERLASAGLIPRLPSDLLPWRTEPLVTFISEEEADAAAMDFILNSPLGEETGTLHDPGDGSAPTYFPGPGETDTPDDEGAAGSCKHGTPHRYPCEDCADEDKDDWGGDRSEP